jgi:hypothetical protein
MIAFDDKVEIIDEMIAFDDDDRAKVLTLRVTLPDDVFNEIWAQCDSAIRFFDFVRFNDPQDRLGFKRFFRDDED